MKRYLLLAILPLSLLLLPACDTFVGQVREPNDQANSQSFTSPTDVNFLLKGVQATWADAYGQQTTLSTLLSDQFRFGTNSDATFPTFRDIDEGLIGRNNNSNDGYQIALGEYRRLADDLVDAARRVEFGENPPLTKSTAIFQGQLHGAISRYMYATFVGLEPRNGGGVIAESEFIPSPAMYDSARVKFESARQTLSSGGVADSSRNAKFLNSTEARSALYAGTEYGTGTGGYSDALQRAAALASQGLEPGDDPVNLLYSVQTANPWYFVSGPGRKQTVVQDGNLNSNIDTYKDPENVRSFPEIVENNPNEASRIPLLGLTAGADIVDFGSEDAVEFIPQLYNTRDAPITFLSWQENHLIRAELELRGYDAGSKSALELVNEVRDSFGLSSLSSVDLQTVAQERDRTLFSRGARLPDQRRFDFLDFHLVDEFQGRTTWQYLPIPQQEIDANPNLSL